MSTASAAATKPNSTAVADANGAGSRATAQRLLANPDTGVIAPQLQLIVDALTEMDRPNSGLTWIRQPHVDRVLRDLARHPTLTHDVIDQLPAGRTTDYMRNLLASTTSFRHVTRGWPGSNPGWSPLTAHHHRRPPKAGRPVHPMEPGEAAPIDEPRHRLSVPTSQTNRHRHDRVLQLAGRRAQHDRRPTGDPRPHRSVAINRAHYPRTHPAFRPMGHQGQAHRFGSGSDTTPPRNRTKDADRNNRTPSSNRSHTSRRCIPATVSPRSW